MGTNYLSLLRKNERLPIFTDMDTLDTYCEYLLNDENKTINYANLTNLKDYIDSMDPKVLMSSEAKLARYEFIKYYLEARLEEGITSRKLCLKYVDEMADKRYQNIIHREIINSIEPGTLKKKDIEFINDMIFTQLNMIFLHRYKIPIKRMLEDLETENFGKSAKDCGVAIELFQSLLSELTKAQRRSKQDNRLNLTDAAHFKATMTEAITRLLSDTQFLQTGWQGLNKMLNGGFENARIYNFIGATGGFKSGLLLNIMKSIKLYNKGREHKDPNKRPTILFISQENNVWETILRIFGIFGTTENIKNFTMESIIKILEDGGFTLVQDDEDIDIEFRYYGNNDVGVSDLRGICEELDNSGREVICIIQDYIERLRPPQYNSERRIQLFDISNQLHDLAIDLDIPIITGSQFNKEGVATIEEMQNSNRYDIGKNVGSKNISESFGMLKNFDVNIGIVIEYDSDEEKYYLSFKKFKFRGADDMSIDYFLQPFVSKKSKIQLQDDLNIDGGIYRLSLYDDVQSTIHNVTSSVQQATRVQKAFTFSESDKYDEDEMEDEIKSYFSGETDFTREEKPKYLRDSNGFIVLLPRVKKLTGTITAPV